MRRCVKRFQSYRKVLFLTCLSFFLVEAFPQLADALVHERDFHVAFVQKLLLLLQLAVLLLVQLVPDLWTTDNTITVVKNSGAYTSIQWMLYLFVQYLKLLVKFTELEGCSAGYLATQGGLYAIELSPPQVLQLQAELLHPQHGRL